MIQSIGGMQQRMLGNTARRWIRAACSSICCATRLRRTLVLLLVMAALVGTVMFSSWNVCRSNYDDDVDALGADVSAKLSRRSRRSAKICLSPLTDAVEGRVNISLDSDEDLQQ